MFQIELPLVLQRHPATPAPMVRTLAASATLNAVGDLALAFCLRGDMIRLRIPEPQAPAQMDGLWEHTCFEVFVGVAGQAAYREFNLSPSGQWAAYAFADYRRPAEPALRQGLLAVGAPRIVTRLTDGRLELEAVIPAAALPQAGAEEKLLLALCAVVEAVDVVDGGHSYWALHHATALPDFHHRDGFVLQLASPRDTGRGG